jgi:hypothetical protein
VPAEANLIQGNRSNGVWIKGFLARLNNVKANTIDSNGGAGVLIDDAPRNEVGGPTRPEGNIITRNYVGVIVSNSGASDNTVSNNLIGVTPVGSLKAMRGNSVTQVQVDKGAKSTSIQANEIAAGPNISADGVQVDSATSTRILDNLIHDIYDGVVLTIKSHNTVIRWNTFTNWYDLTNGARKEALNFPDAVLDNGDLNKDYKRANTFNPKK